MLCSNCGKNEANVRYTRIINGEKTEFALCEDCAKKMGLEDIDFNIPINFSNFLSDFFEDDNLLPSFAKIENERCPKCGLTYDDFVNNGKFGCAECYDTFSNKYPFDCSSPSTKSVDKVTLLISTFFSAEQSLNQ